MLSSELVVIFAERLSFFAETVVFATFRMLAQRTNSDIFNEMLLFF